MPWDPAQYLKFADHRLRPAIDLLNRIELASPAEVYDLGAGAGNVTRLLKRAGRRRASPASTARRTCWRRPPPPARDHWQHADLATWRPPTPGRPHLLQRRAALARRPRAALPRAARRARAAAACSRCRCRATSPRPRTRSIAEAARSGPWRATLEPLLRPSPVGRARLLLRPARAARRRARHLGDGVPPRARGRRSGEGVDEGHVAHAAARRARGARAQRVRGALRRAA